MKVLAVLVLLLIIAPGLGLGAYNAYDWVWGSEAQLRGARAALAEDDFDRADAHLTLYLEAHPGSAEAHLLAARTARRAMVPVLPAGVDGPDPSPGTEAVNSVGSYDKAEKQLAEYGR